MDGAYKYIYDAWNRLAKVTGRVIERYHYSPVVRRRRVRALAASTE